MMNVKRLMEWNKKENKKKPFTEFGYNLFSLTKYLHARKGKQQQQQHINFHALNDVFRFTFQLNGGCNLKLHYEKCHFDIFVLMFHFGHSN